jgi:DNA-binding transcriptional ArsR family regulator
MPKRRVERSVAGVALLFAALGDETRLLLLKRLSEAGPTSISVLADRFSLTRQGITKHLQVLASAGVIDGRREGREHIWELNPERLAEAARHVELIARGWDKALHRLKDLLEATPD